MSTVKGETQVVLVENNAYDRAVLDVCFRLTDGCRLAYTTAEGSAPLGPSDLWQLLSSARQLPDLVLFDLALTPWCGRVMTQSEYRAVLRNASQGLREMDRLLRGYEREQRRALTELTIALRAAAEEPSRPSPVLASPALADLIAGSKVPALVSGLSAARERLGKGTDIRNSLAGLASELWSGEATAWEISRSPSVLRFFLCATSFPDVCFGVVSHFADEDTRLALRTILGARSTIPWRAEREALLDGLIVNKAELFAPQGSGVLGTGTGPPESLALRLRKSLDLWQAMGSPRAMTAPFCDLPVELADASPATTAPFQVSFEKWCREFLPPAVGEQAAPSDAPRCTVFLDQTLLIAGGAEEGNAWRSCGHEGWSTLVHSPLVSSADSIRNVRFGPGPTPARLHVVREEAKADDIESFLSDQRSGGVPPSACCVVVGSSLPGVAEALENAHKARELRLFRVVRPKEWKRRIFGGGGQRAAVARSLVENLRVRDDKSEVHRFLETPQGPPADDLVDSISRGLLNYLDSFNNAYEALVAGARKAEIMLLEGRPRDDILVALGLGPRKARIM